MGKTKRLSTSRCSARVLSCAISCAAAITLLAGCPSPERSSSQPASTDDPNAESRADTAQSETIDWVRPGEIPGRVHIVQRGDTLYSLASRYYGSGQQYNRILVANRNRLRDPNNLPVGMKLIIP